MKIERLELLNDLTDFAEKINQVTSRNQLSEKGYNEIIDRIIEIRSLLKKEMK